MSLDLAGMATAAAAVLLVAWLTIPLGLAAGRLACCRLEAAEAFGLGLALGSLAVFALGLVGTPFGLAATALLALACLATAQLLRDDGLGRPAAWMEPSPHIGGWWPTWAAGLGIAALAAWEGPWLSHTADSFYHLAAARSMLMKNEAFATLPMYPGHGPGPDPTSSGWHAVLALTSFVLGRDVVDVWVAVHPFTAAVMPLALASAGWRLFGSRSIGLVGAGIYVIAYLAFDLREASYPNQLGLASLWAWLSLLVLVLGQPIDTGRSATGRPGGTGRRAAVLALGAGGVAAVHVGLASTLVALAGLVVLVLAARGHLRAALEVGGAAAVGLAVAAVRSLALAQPALLDDRVGVPAYPAAMPSLGGPVLAPLAAAGADAALLTAPTWLSMAAAAALLVAALLSRRARTHRGGPKELAGRGAVDVATTRVALALGVYLVLAPIAAMASAAPPAALYWLIRTASPLGGAQALVLAWALVRAVELVGRPGPSSWGRRAVGAGAALALVLSIGTFGLAALAPRLMAADVASHSFAASQAGDLRVVWAERIEVLRGLPRGTVVAAEPEIAYELAGLVPIYVTATPLSHTPAAIERAGGWLRRGDVLDAIDLAGDPTLPARFAASRRADYLLVDSSSSTWATWRDRPPAPLVRAAGGSDWVLLRVDATRLADAVPAGGASARPPGLPIGAPPWTIAPSAPVAGETALVGVGTAPRPPAPTGAAAAGPTVVLLDPGGRETAAAALSGDVAALAIPPDAPIGRHRLLLRDGAGDTALGDLSVGREYELESFPLHAEPFPGGWTLYSQSFFGRHLAARTNVPASAARPIQSLPAGRYVVLLRVFEYPGTLLNATTVRLGGTAVDFVWGGESDAPRWISNPVQTTALATTLELAARRVEQNWVVVDTIRIYADS